MVGRVTGNARRGYIGSHRLLAPFKNHFLSEHRNRSKFSQRINELERLSQLAFLNMPREQHQGSFQLPSQWRAEMCPKRVG